MAAYVIILIFLFAAALLENESDGKGHEGKWSCAILILFAGLRHETGFDWVEYENYFILTNSVWSQDPQYIEPSLLVEPGFALLNLITKSLGFSFQAFLLLISTINMIVIYVFAKKFTSRIAFVFLIYFGFAFLASQMAAIRQALSYSFLLLAFMYRDDGRTSRSLLMAGLAVSTHTFTVVFVPLLFVAPRNIPTGFIAAVVGVGVAAAFSGFHLVPLAADNLLPFLGGGFLATKLSLYGEVQGYDISYVSLMFIPLHLCLYQFLIKSKVSADSNLSGIRKFAISLTLLSLVSHSFLGVFPAFWNRVSYLTFLVQAVALTALYRSYFSDLLFKGVVTSVAALAGLAIMTYSLTSPTSLPYTPYQNAVIVWVTDDPGDGRARYSYAFQEAERELARMRR